MSGILTIAHLTLFEARRRRIVLAAVVCGLAFLVVFATGLHFAFRELVAEEGPARLQDALIRGGFVGVAVMLGLYAVNFLLAASSVLLSIDTLSGEIGSGVVQTLVSKPLSRAEVLLGKFFGYWLLSMGYLIMMVGGVIGIIYAITGFLQPHIWLAMLLMALEATVLLTVSIAGGTRLSTITNGIVAFGFYGLAVVAGIVEQAGIFLGNRAARDIGTAVSLLAPSDTLWRMAGFYLQPPLLQALQNQGPPIFWNASTPTMAMVVWSIGFVVVVLGMAIRTFNRRPL